jgi:hypothetical protein
VATIITDEGTHEVDGAARPGTVLLAPPVLRDVTGWELKPEGLCRGEVCIPVRGRDTVDVDGLLDVRVVADLLHRPFVVDDELPIAVLGESAATRRAELSGRTVGDFTLSDVDGHPVRWKRFGRKKKVLVAWASW